MQSDARGSRTGQQAQSSDALSVTAFKQSLLAARGLRVPFTKGLRKRTNAKRQWIEAGVSADGLCLLRFYRNEHDAKHVGEFNVMGQEIRIEGFENAKLDPVYPYCISLEGTHLKRKDYKEVGAPLILFTSTHRDQRIMINALMALVASSLSSGLCKFTAQVRDTFPARLSSASSATDPDVRSVRSDQSGSSMGSLRKRLQIRSALPTFGRRKRSSATAAAAVASRGDTASVGSYELNRHTSVPSNPSRSRSPSYSVVDAMEDGARQNPGPRETEYLRTAVQCCRFLFDCRGLAMEELFCPLEGTAKDQAEELKIQFSGQGRRPSLRGCTLNVVSHLFTWALSRLDPGLLPDNVFYRYQIAIDKLTSLDLDKAHSHATAQAAARIVASLSIERAYVLRDVVALYGSVARTEADRARFCRLIAGLVVNSLRAYVRSTPDAPYGALEPGYIESFRILIDTLDSKIIGEPIFEKALSGYSAVERVERLCSDLPTSWAPPATEKSFSAANDQDFEIQDGSTSDPLADGKLKGLADALPARWNEDIAEPSTDTKKDDSVASDVRSRTDDEETKTTGTHDAMKQQSGQPDFEHGASSMADIATALDMEPPQELEISQAAGKLSLKQDSEAPQSARLPRGELPDPLANAVAEIKQVQHTESLALAQFGGPGAFPETDELEGFGASAEEDKRTKNIKRIIKWYKSRLALAPDAQNADLWQQEIRALEEELNLLEQGKDPHCSMAATDASPEVVKHVSALWQRCKESTADALIRKRSDPLRRGPGVAFDEQGKMEADVYLSRPMAALDDSDELLQKVYLDSASLQQHYKSKSPSTVDSLLMGMLEELTQLRLEVNEYQRGVVQRTEEKAREFEARFHRDAAKNGTAIRQQTRSPFAPGDKKPNKEDEARPVASRAQDQQLPSTPPTPPQQQQQAGTSIWSRFINSGAPSPPSK